MSAQTTDISGYSANVSLELRAQGQSFGLATIGPQSVTARTPIQLDACDAEIVMIVDGRGVSWPVRLPNGAVPFDNMIETIPRGEMVRL